MKLQISREEMPVGSLFAITLSQTGFAYGLISAFGPLCFVTDIFQLWTDELILEPFENSFPEILIESLPISGKEFSQGWKIISYISNYTRSYPPTLIFGVPPIQRVITLDGRTPKRPATRSEIETLRHLRINSPNVNTAEVQDTLIRRGIKKLHSPRKSTEEEGQKR
jgi:hypothetical protein